MRRKSLILFVSASLAGCHNGPSLPSADAIVEGRATGVVPDTVDDNPTVKLEAGHWALRQQGASTMTFWEDIGTLDLGNAEKSARSIDERTFAVALRTLMSSDPEAASIAFRALTQTAQDPLVRARAR